VDELCDFSPPLWEGPFFHETQYIDVDIPYNEKSEKYRNFTFDTSAVEQYVICSFMYAKRKI